MKHFLIIRHQIDPPGDDRIVGSGSVDGTEFPKEVLIALAHIEAQTRTEVAAIYIHPNQVDLIGKSHLASFAFRENECPDPDDSREDDP